jgi:prepilin-type N-terminal cleavage/methylation domain-containing protein
MKIMFHRRRLGVIRGFTLIELLVSLAVIVIVTTMSVISLAGNSGERNLTAACEMVSNLVALARQKAITENTPVALVVLTDNYGSGDAVAYRMLALMKYGLDGWEQVTKWEKLPTSIIIDPAVVNSSFFASMIPPLESDEEWSSISVVYRGTTLPPSAYAYQCFMPYGGLLNSDQSVTLRLVQGVLGESKTVQYHHKNQDGAPSNYYDILFLGATGKLKIQRK